MTQARRDGRIWADLVQIYRGMSTVRRRQFYSLIFLMIVGAGAELATIGAILPFISLLTDTGGSQAIAWLGQGDLLGLGAITTGAIVFAVLALFAGAVRLQLVRSVQDFSYRLGHEIMVEIQRRVLLQPYSFHLQRNTSTLLAAIDQVEVLVFELIVPSMQALVAAFLAFFIIAALVWIDPLAAALAAAASTAVYLAVSVVASKHLKKNSDAVGRSFNNRMKVAQESLGGIRDIIIDGSHDLYVRQFKQVDLELSVARANTGFIAAAPRYIIETVGIFIIAAIAILFSQRTGGLNAALPTLGAIAFGAQRLLPLLQQVYNGWSTASGYLSVLSQATDLLALTVDDRPQGIRPLPLKTCIGIDGLSFTYPGRRRPALDRISFEIPAGSAVALVGETGSGKSTLADLLMGLLEPDEGGIAVNGSPLTGELRRRWQRSIAHVPQTIFLADASIARNIALAISDDRIDRTRMIDAARKAQLDAFVETLPDGYDTTVGERGIRLSGGQRQRLGLARAIYKQAPVMVLDEATSALDDATEAAVIDALDKLRREGRTVIMIAHRRSTIARADIVVTLTKGRVADITARNAVAVS